jgi:hypothetical protein
MPRLSPEKFADEPRLEPADIFLTRGTSLLSRLIRFFSVRIGEKRAMVNHVGIVVEGGPFHEAIVVEAQRTVLRHRLVDWYGKSDTMVAVYRPINLSEDEMSVVVHAAESYVGRTYGYFKIITHALDWFLLGAYVFRRLNIRDNYPICSWVVAHAYGKADKHFGVHPGAANPDDIWRFVVSNPEKYKVVRPLELLPKKREE